jgi:ABC-type nitrate/sulfonate/bicarbonate transport system permease component
MARLASDPSRRLAIFRALSIGGFFLLWEFVSRIGVFTPFLLPAPSTILAYLWDDALAGVLLVNIRLTLGRMFTGYVLAALIGIPLGICIARIALVRWFFDPLVSIALPMPLVAFLPIFILWLGASNASKVALIASSCVFPILVQAWAGTQNLDKFLSWSALSLGAGKRALLWEIALPAAMPQIFTGLQIAFPIAFISATVAEMLMGGGGIGGQIVDGMRMSDSPELFAGIVTVGLVGAVLAKVMELIRRRLLVWHAETQAD